MGDVIKFVQTATIPTGGSIQILYTHDPQGKPSRVGLLAMSITQTAQVGASCILYGNDPANMICLSHHAHTPADYSNVIHPNFVIQPGQVIKFYIRDATAGDTVVIMMEGH